jgi:hypothetical protein
MKSVVALLGLCTRVWAGTNADVAPVDPAPAFTARPVIPPDDTRSYGPTARDWIDLSTAPSWLYGPTGDLFELSSQLAVGFPTPTVQELRELYDDYHLDAYQLRLRDEMVAGRDGALAGPLTIGLQRYLPVAPLAISPLIYAHVGIESVLATPWLSGRETVPPETLQLVHGVDRELAANGWSIRPLAAYLRGDFLACRSASFELGIEPEAFAPMNGATELGTRFHVAAGLSSGCHVVRPYYPKLALEYRGRVMMYAHDETTNFRDSIAAAIQIDLSWFVVSAFYQSDLGSVMAHAGAIGLRLQIGAGR